jgi:hypothetical protein
MMFADTSTDDLSPHCVGSRLDINHCRLSIRIFERNTTSLFGISWPFFPSR